MIAGVAGHNPMNIVRRSSFRATPWKNGGGTTFEVLRVPPAADPFRWRVSVAEVAAAGPFSDFSGYRRHLVLLRGSGVRLSFGDGSATTLREAGDRIEFDGAMATHCELIAGPCTDFNLIVANDLDCAEPEVGPLDGARAFTRVAGETQLLFVIAGSVTVSDAAGADFELGPWDLACSTGGDAGIAAVAPPAGALRPSIFFTRLAPA
jgi:environmental stress-induced protein Ves